MGYPNAVHARLELTLDELKSHLEITTTAYDLKLPACFAAAKLMADHYCGSWFTDDDLETGTAVDIPEDVLIGVLMATKRAMLLREPGLKWDSIAGRAKRWPDDPVQLEREAQGYWWPYRMPRF